MKTKFKKDLIQGLLTYPAPVYGGRRNARVVASSQRKFFQIIPAPSVRDRLSRQAASVGSNRRKVNSKLIGGKIKIN